MGCAETAECKIPMEWNEQFYALKLTSNNVREIHYVFREIDGTQSGYIGLTELCLFLDIENTAFTHNLFTFLDKNYSGKIDFREFLLSLWSFLSIQKAQVEMFVFNLYDEDASGLLSHDDIGTMIVDLFGRKQMEIDPLAHSVLYQLNQLNKKEAFTIDRFSEFCQHHHDHGMSIKAIELHQELRERICGIAFWERCSDHRVELSKGKFLSLGDILKLNIPMLYTKLVKNGDMNGNKTQKKMKTSRAQMALHDPWDREEMSFTMI
jgi:Ca2+-binding EF-hand superfamily protein